MANKIEAPSFDDIVFEKRNKEYGAYMLRKKYPRTLAIAFMVGAVALCAAIITPYINAVKVQKEGVKVEEKVVEVVMETFDTPTEQVAAPPPPPPEAPVEAVTQQAKYVPPVVVDSVSPEDEAQFMTADEIAQTFVDEEVEEIIEVVEVVAEEIITEEEPEPEPFITVEEMPSYPGGDAALLQYVMNEIVYPEAARENNVQGRVFIRFCVTATGEIGQVQVLRGVDPEIDAEAVRAVKTIKGFRPGKQGGVAVPVWYQLPINFKLEN